MDYNTYVSYLKTLNKNELITLQTNIQSSIHIFNLKYIALAMTVLLTYIFSFGIVLMVLSHNASHSWDTVMNLWFKLGIIISIILFIVVKKVVTTLQKNREIKLYYIDEYMKNNRKKE